MSKMTVVGVKRRFLGSIGTSIFKLAFWDMFQVLFSEPKPQFLSPNNTKNLMAQEFIALGHPHITSWGQAKIKFYRG